MRAKEFIKESVSDDLLRKQYMEGQCNVFAIALHSADPKRFSIGFHVEFFEMVPDLPYNIDPDLWDLESDSRRAEIGSNPQYWSLIHAYVHDAQTGKVVDANGMHNSAKELLGKWSWRTDEKSVGKHVYPASIQDLASVGTVEGSDLDSGDEFEFRKVTGQEFLNKYANTAALKQAVGYANRKFNLNI